MAVNLERAVLVMGPAGCGKTELVSLLANAMSLPLYRFSFGAMSDARTSLIGTTQYSPEKGSYFLQSRFAQAIQSNNGIILLDEFNRCGPDASNILLPLLDGQRYLSMDESGGTVSVGKAYVSSRRPISVWNMVAPVQLTAQLQTDFPLRSGFRIPPSPMRSTCSRIGFEACVRRQS